MSHLRGFASNTVWLYLAEGVSRVCGLLLMIFIVRFLGMESLGDYSMATSLSMLVATISEFGTTIYLMGRVTGAPEDERNRAFHAAVVLRVIFVAVAFLLFLVYLHFSRLDPAVHQLVLLLGISGALSGVISIYSMAFRIRERLRGESALRALSSVLILVVSFANREHGILAVGYTIVGVTAVMAVLHMVVAYAGRYVSYPHGVALGPEVRRIFWALGPFAAYSILEVLLQRTDFLLVFYLASATELGHYAAAYKIFEMGLMIPAVVGAALFPAFGRLQRHQPERLPGYVRTVARVFLLVALLIVSASLLYADRVFLLLLGEQQGTVAAFAILVWALVPLYLRLTFVWVFISSDRAAVASQATGLQLVLNVVANVLLVPRYGAVGAAAAALIAELGALAFLGASYSRRYGRISVPSLLWRPLLALVPAALVAQQVPLWASFLVFPTLAALGLHLLRVVTPEDLDLVRLVLRSRTAAVQEPPAPG